MHLQKTLREIKFFYGLNYGCRCTCLSIISWMGTSRRRVDRRTCAVRQKNYKERHKTRIREQYEMGAAVFSPTTSCPLTVHISARGMCSRLAKSHASPRFVQTTSAHMWSWWRRTETDNCGLLGGYGKLLFHICFENVPSLTPLKSCTKLHRLNVYFNTNTAVSLCIYVPTYLHVFFNILYMQTTMLIWSPFCLVLNSWFYMWGSFFVLYVDMCLDLLWMCVSENQWQKPKNCIPLLA